MIAIGGIIALFIVIGIILVWRSMGSLGRGASGRTRKAHGEHSQPEEGRTSGLD